jgi:hypothetical protein
MLMYESLYRTGNASGLSIDAYTRKVVWDAYSYLYTKPLAGWGTAPRPRAVNFNDSAALYRPGGDVLMHIATRASANEHTAVALARWLYDIHYASEAAPTAGPFDRATFGLYNAAGFLSFILYRHEHSGQTPEQLGLPEAAAFENGDVLVRRRWNGDTVLAIRAGGGLLKGPSHLHGDMNSFIVTHRKERLLVDPGHSCYRNVTRSIEIDAQSHNTCVFLPPAGAGRDIRQEDLFKGSAVSQSMELKRSFADGRPGPPVDRGTRLLLLASGDAHSAVVADAAAAYGSPVKKFVRSWLVLAESLIVVADEIELDTPHRTEWNWQINNRDNAADIRHLPGGLIVRRNGSGMQIASTVAAWFQGPLYGILHDAYHPEPAQRGEGRPGSAFTFRMTSAEPSLTETQLHLIVLDTSARVGDWVVERAAHGFSVTAPGSDGAAKIDFDSKDNVIIRCQGTGLIPSASIRRNSVGEYQS